jgi:ribosomal protein S18 acetylase RimI-like enzyme
VAACQDPKNDVWVAVVDRRQVGFVVTQTEREGAVNGGQVYMIGVDPAHRRRGVADMLLSHAVAELRAGGVDVVSIATGGDAGHAPARALYRKARLPRPPSCRLLPSAGRECDAGRRSGRVVEIAMGG